ncbi:DeoR family transcriptional regulator [Nocardioides sp. B-3]|uniref:DeoR family transcriptional regulator n=1 Tax=Nocardioides sp. B-3 TaxID=2895565 RepID=UPI003FA5F65B
MTRLSPPGVNPSTIRRDPDSLAKTGRIQRTHGGAGSSLMGLGTCRARARCMNACPRRG